MKRAGIDLMIAGVCLAVAGVCWLYPDQIRGQFVILSISGILSVVFFILAIHNGRRTGSDTVVQKTELPGNTELITELVLLSEENTELLVWDLYGKTALVIGRDVKENQVDVDLSHSQYASMVEVEHAVLNFSAGNWYVEDLGSTNGISVKTAEDGKVYKLSSDNPCRIGRGDCLYIGLNRLLLR